MPAILEVEGVSKSIGDLILFNNISFSISEGDKTGLIAANGTGKTTLLNILAGNEPLDSGRIHFLPNNKVGYLPQEPQLDGNKNILEAVFETDNPDLQLIKQYEEALEGNHHKAIESLSILLDNKKLWDYESRIRQMLSQLGIHNLKQKISELSGGQKKRVAIAAMLVESPDFIMLDEPTNHLDVDVINWLEAYLQRAKISLLMVTHDRYFLDRVCNEIIEIDQLQLFKYKGNYSYFLQKRAERIELQLKEVAKAENQLRKEEDWMRRMPKARSTKAKYRIDNYYDLKDKASKNYREDKIQINVEGKRLGTKILVAKKLNFLWGKDSFLKDFDYIFNPYDKIGLLGANGTGKSTFLDVLTGKLTLASGEIEKGQTIKFGYYRQEGMHFDENMKVLDAVTEIAETIKLSNDKIITASQFLNHFLFPPARQYDYIYKLSGGEKRRLYLCTILMQCPNFLILDEPTNDLDISTLEVLEDYLKDFAGCVLIVSHDRFFLDEVVDHVFVFQGKGEIKDFPGNYSQYQEWSRKKEKEVQTNKPSDKKAIVKEKKIQAKLTYKERLEFQELENEINQLNTNKLQLEEALNNIDISVDKMIEYSTRIGELMNDIEMKEMRWLELDEKQTS
jgi:ABC transport system ATP-binding/permease protein